jgi:hypothetical protein
MTYSEQDVERIVLEVIRRLGLLGASAACEREVAAADLALTEKLITIRTIEGRLTGVKRLIVKPRAIVTPAVRDELKQRNIQLIWK